MSRISVEASDAVSFRVDVQPERDVVFAAPVGELDLETVGELAGQLDQLREVGFSRLVLDLRRLRFMDSSALHLIIDTDDRAQGRSSIRCGPRPARGATAFRADRLERALSLRRAVSAQKASILRAARDGLAVLPGSQRLQQ